MTFSEILVVHNGIAHGAIPYALEEQKKYVASPAKGTTDLFARLDVAAYIQVTRHGETSTWKIESAHRVSPVVDYPQERGVFCLLCSGFNSDDFIPTICDPQ